mmetsp:Transcript_55273/g.147535  ORF Transcript_55273/g.147535 Transcript_55273/m.147535 type:complete len:311 (-) Transcript_55273:307-1239(-)
MDPSSSDSDLEEPMLAGSSGELMRWLAPVCFIGGVVLGAFAGTIAAVSQLAVSVVVVALLVLCNFIPSSCANTAVLSFVCTCLGTTLGFGAGVVSLTAATGDWDKSSVWALRFPLFLVCVVLFHSAEYAFTITFHAQKAQYTAFLLTPVPHGAYSIAMILAVVEFWLETAALNGLHFSIFSAKVTLVIVVTSTIVTLSGWAMRTAALWTAQANFTHLVAHRRSESHELVTHGVYGLCRHPGYAGWFVWCIGTQLVLGTPVCFVLYGAVAWYFFYRRIVEEETLLVHFFGERYLEYAQRVPCGVPCISKLS